MKTTLSLVAVGLLVLGVSAWAADNAGSCCSATKSCEPAKACDTAKTCDTACAAEPADAKAAETQKYPLDTCVVTGQKLGDHPVVVKHEGREVHLCCKGCVATFEKDPAKYLAKLDEAAKNQAK